MSARESHWRALLGLALPALDHVFGPEQDEHAAPRWTLGGGTAIALHLGHRVSFDIDLFVPGIALRHFTPARNPAARLISPKFQWAGHDLKFERPEGEVDFLSPPLQTDPGYIWMDFGERRIAVETSEEVIVKKMRYRSARFTARDVYDLAAVANAYPTLPETIAGEVPDTLDRVYDNLERHRRQGHAALETALVLTSEGAEVLPRVFDIAQAALDRATTLAAGGSGRGPHAGDG